jgi:antitoxin (DNA-binding transcriptional repressor) of toxin-antitoxin stability system
MGTVGVRELAKRASAIVQDVASRREGTIITHRGKPVAYMMPIDAERFEGFVLANAPEFVASMQDADEDLKAGRTISLAEALADDEHAA